MKIRKKTLVLGMMPAATLLALVCLIFSNSANAGVIILGGKAGSINGLTVCDCTLPAQGCGCVVQGADGGGPAPNQP
jgi:hypothetical protein